jgi:hypothetical protein
VRRQQYARLDVLLVVFKKGSAGCGLGKKTRAAIWPGVRNAI